LQALAMSSGRHVSNLSRTLKTMERYGFVRLNKEASGKIRPEVPFHSIQLEVALLA